MPASDVALTFDTQSFEKGAQRASNSMQGMQKTSKAVSGGMMKAFSKLTAILGPLTAGFFAVKGALNQIPEIGKTFSMAGSIISKNLLWPLRKALMPILQNILDWTRENRGTFVRWGQVIANAFRTAVSVGRVFWNIIKNIGGAIRDSLGRFFDFMNRDFTKTMNMLQAKLVFIGQGISLVFEQAARAYQGSGLQKYFNSMLNVFSTVLTVAQDLGAAFRRGFRFKAIGKELDDIFGVLGDIFNMLFPKGADTPSWLITVFETLGEVVSTLAVGGLKAIELAVTGIRDAIQWLIETGFPKFKEKWEEWFGGAESRTGLAGNLPEGVERGGGGKGLFDLLSLMRATPATTANPSATTTDNQPSNMSVMDDALIKPNGQVIRLNPNDYITARKEPGGGPQTINMTVSLAGANINATQGDAERVGYGVAEGIGNRIRDELISSLERGG
jgi:hypothetical protein